MRHSGLPNDWWTSEMSEKWRTNIKIEGKLNPYHTSIPLEGTTVNSPILFQREPVKLLVGGVVIWLRTVDEQPTTEGGRDPPHKGFFNVQATSYVQHGAMK